MELRQFFSHKTHFSIQFISLRSKTFEILFLVPNFYLSLLNFTDIVAEQKRTHMRLEATQMHDKIRTRNGY